jgi:hypothetical protein
VDDAAARGLDFRSRQFREAWFVTCGPLGGPLSGDMVISGSSARIDRFIACMSRQGFELPRPQKRASAGDVVGEWRFDMTRTRVDTSTRGWNRAMFAVCGPRG